MCLSLILSLDIHTEQPVVSGYIVTMSSLIFFCFTFVDFLAEMSDKCQIFTNPLNTKIYEIHDSNNAI